MTIEQVQESIDKAGKRIAPSWPLQNSVAVNPFLGLSDQHFSEAAGTLLYRGGVRMYMPIPFYLHQLDKGAIQTQDLQKALERKQMEQSPAEYLHYLRRLGNEEYKGKQLYTLVDVLASSKGKDHAEAMVSHCSEWLAAYFNGIADRDPEDMYRRWRRDARVDLKPELFGVTDFRTYMGQTSPNGMTAILKGLEELAIPRQLIETYLHALLLKILGWSSYCSGLDWQSALYGGETTYVHSLLAMLIQWEAAILNANREIATQWRNTVRTMEADQSRFISNEYLQAQAVLQDAFDLGYQRSMITKFNARNSNGRKNEAAPYAQMVFCIDVRSEVYRRNLERIDPRVETLGFAGFFGFPVRYHALGHTMCKDQCPVLIPAGPKVYETAAEPDRLKLIEQKAKRAANLKEAWSKFRSGSVSSFGFVSPLGLFYLPKLVSDSLGWTKPVSLPKTQEFGRILSGQHRLDVEQIPFGDRVNMAKNALTAMGLTDRFARMILITGHGSTSVNNPHASGLDCGACGGSSGEINALTAQLVLNDMRVRQALIEQDIHIPKDSCFVACVHDTSTDEVRILDQRGIPETHRVDLEQLQSSLDQASTAARRSRAPRLGINGEQLDKAVLKRANDWAQVRPEWGLAGCHSFVIAPRYRTKGMDLAGRSFLHSYQWRTDHDFKVLETIMTAPMVVTSWINLQYYASSVDNQRLGAGNKTLHNVTSQLGVLEGSRGDLRIGLPFQSVHDGTQLQHLPIRLNVVIEAPRKAINRIIESHPNVADLCDNEWIVLLAMNDQGKISHRYVGSGQWESVAAQETVDVENEKQYI